MNAWQLWNSMNDSELRRREFLRDLGVSVETAKIMAGRRFEELSKWLRTKIKRHVRNLRRKSPTQTEV